MYNLKFGVKDYFSPSILFFFKIPIFVVNLILMQKFFFIIFQFLSLKEKKSKLIDFSENKKKSHRFHLIFDKFYLEEFNNYYFKF